jgi:transcriptional regulator with XRE-family HTH domain
LDHADKFSSAGRSRQNKSGADAGVLSSSKADRYRSLVEHEPDWSVRMTARIGERVAWFREQKTDASGKKMTVQALADRCAELGLPLGRVTITKLERGNRQAITPAEVMVLAAALEVPPVELLFPIGAAEAEILPGRMVATRHALGWFCGSLSLQLAGEITGLLRPPPGEESSVRLLDEHDEIVRQWTQSSAESAMAITAARSQGREGDANAHVMAARGYRHVASDSLRRIRAELSRRGVALPPLPADLRLEDGEQEVPS